MQSNLEEQKRQCEVRNFNYVNCTSDIYVYMYTHYGKLCICMYSVQWNLSNLYILGTDESVLISEVS